MRSLVLPLVAFGSLKAQLDPKYLRFKGTTGDNYYQSFRVDSMRVGNSKKRRYRNN